VTGTSRYVIYGVITAILSAERVEALDARYKAIAAGGTAAVDPRGLVIDSKSGTNSGVSSGEPLAWTEAEVADDG
jgi:hypothetical protein